MTKITIDEVFPNFDRKPLLLHNTRIFLYKDRQLTKNRILLCIYHLLRKNNKNTIMTKRNVIHFRNHNDEQAK
jgi:hypothetical protein